MPYAAFRPVNPASRPLRELAVRNLWCFHFTVDSGGSPPQDAFLTHYTNPNRYTDRLLFMNVMFRSLLGVCGGVLTLLTSASAQITELPTDSTTDTLWRTAAANDVDGDGRYGSDGYLLYAWNMAPNVYLGNGYNASTANSQNIWVKPSYIGDVVSPTDHAVYSGFNGNYGTLENPAGGTHNAAVLLANGGGNGNSIRLRITRTSDWPFRLTLIIGQNQASDSQNITVTITNATSTNVLATTTTGQPTVPVVSYKQFDIAQGLDDIQIEINGGGNGDNTHLTGLAFDHVGGAVQPEISQQPQGGTFLAGVPWQLAVTAAGGSLQYQWFKGNTALPGATNAALSFASLATTDAGSYSVVVSNTVGVVTSAVAVVAVETALPQRLVNYQAALANELSIISHYGFDRLTAADTTTLHPGTLQGTVRCGEGVGRSRAFRYDGNLDSLRQPYAGLRVHDVRVARACDLDELLGVAGSVVARRLDQQPRLQPVRVRRPQWRHGQLQYSPSGRQERIGLLERFAGYDHSDSAGGRHLAFVDGGFRQRQLDVVLGWSPHRDAHDGFWHGPLRAHAAWLECAHGR